MKKAKIHWQILKIFSRTTWPISTKLSTKHPWLTGIPSLFKLRTLPFSKRDNFEITKIHWQVLKISFSRTTEPNLHKASLGEGNLSLFKWRDIPFSKGRWLPNNKNTFIWRNVKIFFSRTTGPVSTKLVKKNSWVKSIYVCSNWRATPFTKGREEQNCKKTFSKFKKNLLFQKYCSNVFIDLNWFFRWAMWPMGLLFKNLLLFCWAKVRLTELCIWWAKNNLLTSKVCDPA